MKSSNSKLIIAFVFLITITSLMSAENYQTTISISPSTPVDNYQIKINLNSSFNYSTVLSDGSDIRFSDGVNNLSYWIDTWVYGGDSTIWVKVKNNGTSSILLQSTNTTSTSQSNGSATFLVFDDFNDGTLDPMWTVDGTIQVTESGGKLSMYTNSDSSWGLWFGVHTNFTEHINSGIALEMRNLEYDSTSIVIAKWGAILGSPSSNYLGDLGVFYQDNHNNVDEAFETPSNDGAGVYATNQGTSPQIYNWTVTRNETGYAKYIRDGVQKATSTNANNTINELMLLVNRAGGYTFIGTYKFDGVFVREYSGNDLTTAFGDTSIVVTVPTVTSVILNSSLGTNLTIENLNGYYTYTNSSPVTLNQTRWYKSNVLQTQYNNLTSLSSSYTNSYESWIFSVRVYDSNGWSNWVNSSALTIIARDEGDRGGYGGGSTSITSNISKEIIGDKELLIQEKPYRLIIVFFLILALFLIVGLTLTIVFKSK